MHAGACSCGSATSIPVSFTLESMPVLLGAAGGLRAECTGGGAAHARGASVAEIELRHGVAVESFAAVGPRRGQRVHVLDSYWTRGWAAEELAGRRLPASPTMPPGPAAMQSSRSRSS